MAKNETQVKPTKVPEPPPAPAAPKAKTIPGIRVVAKAEGFRRAGRAWSKAGTDLPVASLKKGDLAALRAEPRLIVTDIEIPATKAEE